MGLVIYDLSLDAGKQVALNFIDKTLQRTLSLKRDLRFGLFESLFARLSFKNQTINGGKSMKNLTTRQLVELSFYSALIFISVQFLRIPLGAQFVHFGNALVVIAVLLFGSRIAALVASIGLGLFDVLNGYAAEVWITILESLIVCLVLQFVFEKLLHSDTKTRNVIIVGIVAAITKIISNLVKYT